MLGITDVWTYVLGVVFIILLPGPNSLYVLSVAAQRGVRAGYLGACGIFVGDTVLMTVAAVGGASLLASSPALFLAVKVVGAAYLGWIGLQLLSGAWKAWRAPVVPGTVASVRPADPEPGRIETAAADRGAPATAVDARQPFRKALVISLLNPKAILFLLSFFIQFVDPAYPHPALTFLALGSIIQIFSFAYLSALIFAGARLAEAFRARRRLAGAASASVGALFLGFGAKLAAATL